MKQIFPYFSQNPLNRLEHDRPNLEELKRLQNSAKALFVLYDGQEIITDSEGKCFFNKTILSNYPNEPLVLLGVDKLVPYFALHVNALPKNTTPSNLRDIAQKGLVEKEKLGILAQAQSVLNWHSSHQFCSSCGKKTIMAHAGWRRDCPTCNKEHFPRTDPVVIMLVTYGDECLLGSGINFPPNRYSCLAGFIESGESVEDAARRELFEEAGLRGGEVSYIASQPWPFPSSLMLGVHVKALSKELHVDKNELTDARWVKKEDIKKILDGDESFGILAPRHIAIARNLLEWWVR